MTHPASPADNAIDDISDFFHPRGVAIVGRVDTSPFTTKRNQRFGCPVYFVNPKGGGTDEVKVYKSLAETPDTTDLVIVKVGPRQTIELMDEIKARGIRNVLVFTNGFGEIGGEGVEYERQLVEAVRRTGLRVIGPNTNENMFESFAPLPGHRGGLIGLITQSGFQGRAVVEGTAIGAGFTRWIPLGNEAGLEVADIIEYYARDPQTAAIAGYIEGFKSAPKLRRALQVANDAAKPVVLLKMGATERGAKMATSHTGHLTGSNAVINGLFAQHGVTRVDDLDELLETANLFAKFPKAGTTGIRCALYSVSGGSVTLMAEHADACGIPAPKLTEETQAYLKSVFPPYLEIANPIDNGGAFLTGNPPEVRLKALDAIAADPNIDVVVIGVTGAYPGLSDPFSQDLLAWAPTAKKPVVATWNSPSMNTPAYENVLNSGVPIFRSFRGCFQALRAYADYGQRAANFRRRDASASALTAAQSQALATPGVLSGQAAATLLADAGVPMVKERLVQTAAQAVAAAREMGLPVALKLISPAFPHKSDVGLVRLGVADLAAVETVHAQLVARARQLDPNAVIDGVVVQEQIGKGVEMIVGLSQDVQFGPVLTIGAGGIHAEILKDVAVRPLPVDRDDVREMIASLKLSPLLDGVRGAPACDKEALVDVAMQVARLGLAAGSRLAELDLNPVIALPDRAVAVDALAVAAAPAQA